MGNSLIIFLEMPRALQQTLRIGNWEQPNVKSNLFDIIWPEYEQVGDYAGNSTGYI